MLFRKPLHRGLRQVFGNLLDFSKVTRYPVHELELGNAAPRMRHRIGWPMVKILATRSGNVQMLAGEFDSMTPMRLGGVGAVWNYFGLMEIGSTEACQGD